MSDILESRKVVDISKGRISQSWQGLPANRLTKSEFKEIPIMLQVFVQFTTATVMPGEQTCVALLRYFTKSLHMFEVNSHRSTESLICIQSSLLTGTALKTDEKT
ncbi:hypothetical protein HUJ05_012792 [Dendroctonus ponderosae]|nr:hypothetical protein HUJ05_012792 [Dendroctonus ponderosae]